MITSTGNRENRLEAIHCALRRGDKKRIAELAKVHRVWVSWVIASSGTSEPVMQTAERMVAGRMAVGRADTRERTDGWPMVTAQIDARDRAARDAGTRERTHAGRVIAGQADAADRTHAGRVIAELTVASPADASPIIAGLIEGDRVPVSAGQE